MRVPVSTPDITQADVDKVAEIAKSGWISGVAPVVREFEEAFAEFIGTRYAVATGSGTTALHLACATLNIGFGDKVIMPTFTMIASANAVSYCGGRPTFVDSDPETWNMDIEQIKDKIDRSTVAIMPIHLYGHMCDMKPILDLAEDHNLWVIEDAAEAHGAEIDGIGKAGSIGQIGAFSLYANKIITTGEGGILTMDYKKDYERAVWLRAHAFGKHGRHYWHEEIGYGYRMGGLQAALGLSQVGRIEKYIEHRRMMAQEYIYHLNPLKAKGFFEFPVERPGFKNVYWMFNLLLKPELDREELMDRLEEAGIETRTFFYPLHKMPPYKSSESFPVAEDISKRGMSLPSGNQLTPDQVLYVCDKIKELLID